MKTAITSKDNKTASLFDLRFGRGAWFCVYDSETRTTEFIKNEFADAQSGAGTKAAEKMLELGVRKLISGDFGSKAKEILTQFNIQMVILDDEEKTINDIIMLIS